MARDLAEFGRGSNEGCHLVAERLPKMVFNLRPEPFFVPPAGLEDNIAARNKSFDSREAEELKLAPQSLHLHCPPVHVNRAQEKQRASPDLLTTPAPAPTAGPKTVSAPCRTML